jgi:hypothetical protein
MRFAWWLPPQKKSLPVVNLYSMKVVKGFHWEGEGGHLFDVLATIGNLLRGAGKSRGAQELK